MAALISMATLLLLLLYFRFFLYRRVAQTNLKLVMSFFSMRELLYAQTFSLHFFTSYSSHHIAAWAPITRSVGLFCVHSNFFYIKISLVLSNYHFFISKLKIFSKFCFVAQPF